MFDHKNRRLVLRYTDPPQTTPPLEDDGEVGFGVDAGAVETEAQPQDSPLNRQNLSERRDGISQTIDRLSGTKKGSDAPWKTSAQSMKSAAAPKGSPVGAKEVAHQAETKAATKLATTVGTRLAESTIGGPIGAALAAATTTADVMKTALQSARVRWTIVYICLGILALCFIVISAGFGTLKSLHLPGPHVSGGSAVEPTTDSYDAAVAAHASGLITADSLAALDFAATNAKQLLTVHPPKGADVAKAQALLDQINGLKPALAVGTFGNQNEERARTLKQYKDLVTQLYGALYPGRASAQAQVLPLLGGTIQFGSAGCAPEHDLHGLALDENIYKVIFAAAQYMHDKNQMLSISCLITGHRKYVGHPPSAGFPRCGEASVVAGATASPHCSGRGVDFTYSSELEQFFMSHQVDLNISQVIHETSPVYLHITVRRSL